jgi:hypothetical protein
MAVEIVNFTINQGETWSEEVIPVALHNYSGYTGRCQIRATAEATSPVIASPLVEITGEGQRFSLSLTAAETLALPVGGTTVSSTTVYLYDVFLTSADTLTTTKSAQGTITVIPAVTR